MAYMYNRPPVQEGILEHLRRLGLKRLISYSTKEFIHQEDVCLSVYSDRKLELGEHSRGVLLDRHIYKIFQLRKANDIVKDQTDPLKSEPKYSTVDIDIVARGQVRIKAHPQRKPNHLAFGLDDAACIGPYGTDE